MANVPDTRRFEDYPLTRAEYISALAHLYRGELARNLALGPIPWWVVASVVASLYGALLVLLLVVAPVDHPESEWEAARPMELGEHL